MAPPFLSIIVPVFDTPEMLEACLLSIRQSDYEDYEILVADDGSPDPHRLACAAQRSTARLIRLERNNGPAFARNAAAKVGQGMVLVFLDCDVTVHRDTLGLIAAAFHADSELDALFGSYDMTPKVTGIVAVFRNLLHAHVHHRSAGYATTFWTGCGAVLRSRFAELGGFDEEFRAPSIEDVEFGMRLHDAGGRILLKPDAQVTHHKEWTIVSMLHTDVIRRAMPWTKLMMSRGLPKNLNFRWQDRLTVFAATMIPLFGLMMLSGNQGARPAMFLTAAAVVALQYPFFRRMAELRGIAFSIASFPLYVIHSWCAGIGLLLGLAQMAGWRRTRSFLFLLVVQMLYPE